MNVLGKKTQPEYRNCNGTYRGTTLVSASPLTGSSESELSLYKGVILTLTVVLVVLIVTVVILHYKLRYDQITSLQILSVNIQRYMSTSFLDNLLGRRYFHDDTVHYFIKFWLWIIILNIRYFKWQKKFKVRIPYRCLNTNKKSSL